MFACAQPLTYWGDAVQYAVHIFNRSPARANAKRASPLEVLTGKTPDLRGIVVFGFSCSVYRDPCKNSLLQPSKRAIFVESAIKPKTTGCCYRVTTKWSSPSTSRTSRRRRRRNTRNYSARWTLAINTETWRSRTHYSSSGERRSRREQQSDAEEERKAMDASGAKNAARRKASKLLLVGRRQPRAERL